MSCERHCKECQREAYYSYATEMRLELEARLAGVDFKSERKFAWKPVRDPKSGRLFWLREVILTYEPYVRFAYLSILSLIDYRLISVSPDSADRRVA